jgi:adiponectin receptor
MKDDMTSFVAPLLTSMPTTRWPFFVFLGGAMFCLLSSATCHLLSCHSAWASYILLRIDYAGIASLIAASFYPPVYYSFMCDPTMRNLYLTGITSIGIATILVTLVPIFQTPKYRHYRAILFFCMALSGVVPCVHKIMIHFHEPAAMATLTYEVLMAFFYGLGAVIYATRIPERWKPGHFDIAGHSHQLFHVLVVMGAFTHYKAGLLYLEWRDVQGCT